MTADPELARTLLVKAAGVLQAVVEVTKIASAKSVLIEIDEYLANNPKTPVVYRPGANTVVGCDPFKRRT